MKTRLLFLLLVLVIASALLIFVSASAQGGFSLDWWTVDGGGAVSSVGGDFGLGGTIGQPDAGVSSGGNYALSGGFWGGGETAASIDLFLPLITR